MTSAVMRTPAARARSTAATDSAADTCRMWIAPALVARDRGVALDHRALRDRGDAGEAEHRRRPRPRASRRRPESDGSSSCSASTPPASRWYWSAWRMRRASTTGKPSSLKPAAPSRASSTISVSSRARLALGDRGQEADRHDRLVRGTLLKRAQHRRRVDDRVGVGHREDAAEAARGRGARCPTRGPPRPRGRACAGARGGRRSPGITIWPSPSTTSQPPGGSSAPGAPISAITPSRTSRS